MTRTERQAEASAYVALCERVREKLGKALHDLSDAQLRQRVTGEELAAALWLRWVAGLSERG